MKRKEAETSREQFLDKVRRVGEEARARGLWMIYAYPDVKAKYYYLRDGNGQPRMTVCLLVKKTGKNECQVLGRGASVYTPAPGWPLIKDFGRDLAYLRATGALESKKPILRMGNIPEVPRGGDFEEWDNGLFKERYISGVG